MLVGAGHAQVQVMLQVQVRLHGRRCMYGYRIRVVLLQIDIEYVVVDYMDVG